jgi:hypothetical protein
MASRRLSFRSLAFAIALYPAIAGAQTPHVSLVLDERGVTLDARDATLREVLSEWERVGGMKLLNAEVLDDRRVTLQVSAVGEREALDILLRDLGGYVLGVRGAGASGGSQFGTLVLAANRGPAPRVPTPALPLQATFTLQNLGRDVQQAAPALPAPDETPATPSVGGFGLPRGGSAPAGGVRSEPEEELVEGAHASTLVPKELRPPTPYDPTTAPSSSDPRRPFGGVGASTPGTITAAPTPGVFAPTVDPRAPARTQP